MIPGETIYGEGSITLNVGRPRTSVVVHNPSTRVVFISSHYPISEANRGLALNRAAAIGFHLDIPAGDAVRWMPGETKTVALVAYGGARVIRGFNGLIDGPVERRSQITKRILRWLGDNDIDR